jgi:ABC-type antimicrobial peptide transport system permease subunit
VVVDRRFADRFSPQASPIGRRIQVGRPDPSTGEPQRLTIVGVTPALPYFGPDQVVPDPMVFVPGGLANTASRTVSLLVRGGADAIQIAQTHVTALDPDLPLFAVQSIGDAVARTRYPTRVLATLFGCLALIAVTLATVGLASLTAHGVVQRTQETGVRLALGARRSRIVWTFARRTCVQLSIGLTVGVAGALALGRVIAAILRDTNPRDPQTLVIVTALVGLVSIIATLIPARRAVLAEPANALRHE